MGLQHSGHCANIAFYVAVEKYFINELPKYGIITWLRYHDDIFIVFKDRLSMISFLEPLLKSSAYFKLLTTQVSSTAVDFLDVTVTVVNQKLMVQPSLQKIPTPLCYTSAHHTSVHFSWPRAVGQRVRSLAYDVDAALTQLQYQYSLANTASFTMDLLLQELPAKRVSSPLALHPVTFVSRYHPLFAHALSQAMAKAPMPLDFGM